MPRPARRFIRLGLLAALGLLVLVAASAQAAAPVATAAKAKAKAKACPIGALRGKAGFPTYVETLTVTGVSCASGDAQIKSYNACRLKNGGLGGKCKGKVNGYTCREQRSTSPGNLIGLVTCTRGADVVKFSYSQFT